MSKDFIKINDNLINALLDALESVGISWYATENPDTGEYNFYDSNGNNTCVVWSEELPVKSILKGRVARYYLAGYNTCVDAGDSETPPLYDIVEICTPNMNFREVAKEIIFIAVDEKTLPFFE